MAAYEEGYRQALLDMRANVSVLVNEPNVPNDGKLELLGVVSLINEMIKGTIERPTDPADHGPRE